MFVFFTKRENGKLLCDDVDRPIFFGLLCDRGFLDAHSIPVYVMISFTSISVGKISIFRIAKHLVCPMARRDTHFFQVLEELTVTLKHLEDRSTENQRLGTWMVPLR